MKRKDILEGWGNNDLGSSSRREFKRREMEHELGHEDEMERRQRRTGYASRPPVAPAPRPAAPIASSSQQEYHLRNTDTGKLLSKEGKPSVFSGQRHAQSVAAKLKFGNWKVVPVKAQEDMAEGDDYDSDSFEKWKKQKEYEKEYNKKKPVTPDDNKKEEQGITEMDNRTASGDRREQRASSPEAQAQREKEQQERLKKVSPEMRKKLRLPEPQQGVAEGEQRMSRAAKGHEKYGKTGMAALAAAGREGASEKTLDTIRTKYDQYTDEMTEAGEQQLKVQQVDKATGNVTAIDPTTQKTTQLKAADLKPGAQPGTFQTKITDPNEIKAGTTITATTEEDLEQEAVHRISGMGPIGQGELSGGNVASPIGGAEEHDEITKLLVRRMRELAGLEESTLESSTADSVNINKSSLDSMLRIAGLR